jgi:hypothetical protein
MKHFDEIKTIDIQVLEWFDKANGNSYFASEVTINYGMDNEDTFVIPFKYGYGDHAIKVSLKEIQKRYEGTPSYIYEIRELGVIVRTNRRDALKRELVNLSK